MSELTAGIFDEIAVPDHASPGKRFANYIIDIISFYLLCVLIAIVYIMIDEEGLQSYIETMEEYGILDRIVTLILFGIYMGCVEAITNGRSLGKLITGTIAIRQDGNRITAADGFKRGLCRSIPFEVFSGLKSPCYPWHDRWTNTMVVSKKELEEIKMSM